MPVVDEEVVSGRLQRGDADLARHIEAKIRSGIGITFQFQKGTIVAGEMLKLLADDRAIEFVVNSELPEPPGDEAIYDGRILNDHEVGSGE